jgi:Putative MetA-pathway of phenol degradation
MLCHFDVLIVTLVGGTVVGFAQTTTRCGSDAAITISTDRPQITSSSIVVPCGSLQFENGFQETNAGGEQTYDLPETSIRFGIARETELRYMVPDYYWNFAAASGAATGLGDMSLEFKQQLGPVKGFDVSIVPSVSFPTGANAISSHGYNPMVQLPWSRGLSKNWTVAGMFSMAWPTQAVASGGTKRNATGQGSVYFDRQLTSPWDAWVEYSGSFPQRGGPQNIIDFGTSYKVTPHQQLDFHAGFGLSSAAPDHFIGFGYSVRFQVIRPK